MIEPINDSAFPPYMRRTDAARYIRETYGIPCVTPTLAKYAWNGSGPAFRKAGKFPIYSRDDLDVWAKQRLGKLVRSTSEPHRSTGLSFTGVGAAAMKCHCCGQALCEMRLGIRMTALKARLFDLIKRGGIDGISSEDLYPLLYPDGGASRQTLKAHVWQINEMIADEGYRIDGRAWSYRLVDVRKRETSPVGSITSIGGTSNLARSHACDPKAERR